MANFAKLDENNIVITVNCVSNDILDIDNEESSGIAFLTEWSGGYSNWKQTSWNANIRKNYAGIDFTYDPIRDAFIPPKPYNSWVIDEDTCLWKAPVAMPNDDGIYTWNESTTSWDLAE